jgi:hypothetical protein
MAIEALPVCLECGSPARRPGATFCSGCGLPFAPFDVVRWYLVTGVVDGGRLRAARHDAIVNAMTQIARWGTDVQVFGDDPEWAEARAAVAALMERYHRSRA